MKTRLKELRKAAGFGSARAFAEYMDMNVGTYTSYEQNRRAMPIDVACSICDELDCTLDELMGRKRHYENHVVDISGISPEGRRAVEDFADFTRHRELAARAIENGDTEDKIA